MIIDPFIVGICAAILAATPVTIAFVNAIGKDPAHKLRLLRLIGVQVVYGLFVFVGAFTVSSRLANNKANLKAEGNGKEAAQNEKKPVQIGHNDPPLLAPPPWATPATLFSIQNASFSDFVGQRVQWVLEFEEVNHRRAEALFHYERPPSGTPIKILLPVTAKTELTLNKLQKGARYTVIGTIAQIEPDEYVALNDPIVWPAE